MTPLSYTNQLRLPPTLTNLHKTKNGFVLRILEKELNKKISVKVSYATRNTIKILLSTHNHTQQDKCEKSGTYKLTYPDCKKADVGQLT
jgi:hypothetical protein